MPRCGICASKCEWVDKPGSVVGTAIYLERVSPRVSSTQPERTEGHRIAFLFALAPDGVYQADKSPCRWCALTAPFHPYLQAGGLFSVALSLRSPSLAVSQHPALRSPDFPQPCGRDHFTYSSQHSYVLYHKMPQSSTKNINFNNSFFTNTSEPSHALQC